MYLTSYSFVFETNVASDPCHLYSRMSEARNWQHVVPTRVSHWAVHQYSMPTPTRKPCTKRPRFIRLWFARSLSHFVLLPKYDVETNTMIFTAACAHDLHSNTPSTDIFPSNLDMLGYQIA